MRPIAAGLLIAGTCGMGGAASGQEMPTSRGISAPTFELGLPSIDGPGFSAWSLQPDLSVGLNWTDNARLAPANQARSDYFMSIDPGLLISGRTAAASGSLRVVANNYLYASEKSNNRTDLLANGQASFNVYERKAFIDTSVNSSMVRVSVLGAPPSTGGYDPQSQTNLQVYSVSPYFRWAGSGSTSGEVRYRATYTDSDSSSLQQYLKHDLSVSLGQAASKPFGWSFQAAYSMTDYHEASDIHSGSARATGYYAADPLLIFRLIGGYERNDYASTVGRDQVTYGGGFDWNPSPRTRFSAQSEKRFFGTGYNYEMSWRGPRSALSASFVRDVSSSASTVNAGGLTGLYFTELAALAREIPDLEERKRRLNESWRSRGLPLDNVQGQTYVSNSYYVEKRAQLTSSLIGVRNSIGLTGHYVERERLLSAASLPSSDDLSRFERTKEIGADFYLTHSLSPRTQLSLLGSISRSKGEANATADSETQRRYLQASSSSTLGPRTSATILYRYSNSSGATEYHENAVGANLGLRF